MHKLKNLLTNLLSSSEHKNKTDNPIKEGKIGGSMKTTDLVFVDIETTGLDARVHEIIDVAVLRVSQDWTGPSPVFTVVSEWSTKIRPENIAVADRTSLKINGYVPSEWKHATSIKDAMRDFSKKTEGAIMVAHNVAFDSEFLNHTLARLEIPNKMHYHRIDTVSMAYAILHKKPQVTRFSLGELSKYFDIPHENAHTALADVYADFEVFKKLMSL